MKIAMFLDEFPTLTETFILNQIAGLIDRGHEVDLFARFRGQYLCAHAEVESYGLNARVLYMDGLPPQRTRRAWEAVKLVFRTPRWWSPTGLRVAARIVQRRSRGEMHSMLNLIRVASRCLGRRYDVVHCQYATIGRRILPLLEMGLVQGPLITSIRGHDVTDSTRTGPGYEALFAHCMRFLPVSNSLRTRLIQLGCPVEKIEVLHSGIDCERFGFDAAVDADAGPGSRPVVLLTVARLVEMKGLDFAISAVAALVDAGRDVEYHIIGDGPRRAHLEASIRDSGIAARVHLHGWQPHDRIAEWLTRADVFVMPSVTTATGQAEGIPNALKEAMARGVAVVATDHSGTPELVEHGISGYLVPEQNVEALARELFRLVDDPGLRRRTGHAAQLRVRTAFDKEPLNDRLEEIYREVCNANAAVQEHGSMESRTDTLAFSKENI